MGCWVGVVGVVGGTSLIVEVELNALSRAVMLEEVEEVEEADGERP